MLASVPHIATWLICAGVLTGVILRPWGLPEAWWVALGVAVLILCSLITLPAAWIAIRKGTDVYLFLAGMMLLAELARHEGLFEWLAAWAVQRARGSASRLFALVYSVGTLVTIFLSNDATAVVLTPAVYAVAMRARARPMPYLYTCAFIANAASFVLPISNPANLVVYGSNMPPLGRWLEQFGVAALLAVVVTFLCLRFLQRAALRDQIAQDVRVPALTSGGRLAAGGILAAALLLLLASGLQWQLGLPTISAGVVTTVVIVMSGRIRYWNIVKSISWSVLPLVAGLFVLVAAIEADGCARAVAGLSSQGDRRAAGGHCVRYRCSHRPGVQPDQ